MLKVPSGRFTMGRNEGDLNQRPAHTVELKGFAIDRTEVAAADFAEFLNASGNPDARYFTPNEYATVIAAPTNDGNQNRSFTARPGFERFPANNVSWQGADAYCRWRGKRLPTEAEWEKAARGTDKRLFPWGKDVAQEAEARFKQIWQEKQFGVLVPVDALPEGASPYGALNMAGNVLEWVNDWYRQNLCDFCNPYRENNLDLILQLTRRTAEYPIGEGVGATHAEEGALGDPADLQQQPPRCNPRGPSQGAFKVLRGGSWQDFAVEDISTTRRFWLDPLQRFSNTGFRCMLDTSGKP